MLSHDPGDVTQLLRAESEIARQRYRPESKFGGLRVAVYLNMCGSPTSWLTKYIRHGPMIAMVGTTNRLPLAPCVGAHYSHSIVAGGLLVMS